MTTRLLKLLLAAVLCLQVPQILSSQTPEEANTYADSIRMCSRFRETSTDRAKPSSDFLRARGIEISEPSLIAALQSDSPEVRTNAAGKLLGDCDIQSIPAIEKAMSAETDASMRADLATGLASFGDPVGAKYLVAMCTDPSLPTLAMSAAVHGLALAHYAHPQFPPAAVCADTVLNLFDSRPSSKVDMIELFVAMRPDVSQSQVDRMVADAQSLLPSDIPSDRMAGSEVLAQLNSTASIEAIRNAILREANPTVRASLQGDLDTLLKQK